MSKENLDINLNSVDIDAETAKENRAAGVVLNEKQLAKIKDNMMKTKENLQKDGIAFAIIIPPNKERVYPEFMPWYYKAPAPDYAALQIYRYLKENTDVSIVYPYEELMKAKKLLEEKELDRIRALKEKDRVIEALEREKTSLQTENEALEKKIIEIDYKFPKLNETKIIKEEDNGWDMIRNLNTNIFKLAHICQFKGDQ